MAPRPRVAQANDLFWYASVAVNCVLVLALITLELVPEMAFHTTLPSV